MAKTNILDLSYHNKGINFKELAKHTKVIILRVQDGTFFDPKYVEYAKACKANGIAFGVYSFCRYTDTNSAIAEARRFYTRATTGGLSPNFYFLDVETPGQQKLASATEAYRKELIRLGGKKVGIYIAHHLRGSSSINFSKFDKVWIPRYGYSPAYACDLHQYTEHGKVSGVPGRVDMNKIVRGDDSWYLSGINGSKPTQVSKPKPSKKPEYFKETPGSVRAKVKIGLYRDKEFKKKVREYPKGTQFNKVKVVKYGNITRFKLNTKEELYITSNKAYVEAVYYGSNTLPKEIELTKTAFIYKSPEFTEANKVRSYPKGTRFTIVGYAKSKGGTTRLKTKSGHYITANKDFSKKLK